MHLFRHRAGLVYQEGLNPKPHLFSGESQIYGGENMYAVIETGGKQYRVQVGDTFKVDKLPAEAGETVEVNKVLAVSDGESLRVGTPLLEGVKVILKVLKHGKGKKIVIFKFKAKKNYRRKQGHRQPFTQVTVDAIEV
ncbi:50S ribosomal protein L21 [Pelotomaculum propionicicum]|uniref:Large ribosomal subunit protein bL21 n=2 Tax=Pelotomaculum propionicicum TaxID=258475 RepID=A0A4Y7RV53_9FIRM|nr:50S ribosomal protein L21 [Pelotomaculum propionicicum]